MTTFSTHRDFMKSGFGKVHLCDSDQGKGTPAPPVVKPHDASGKIFDLPKDDYLTLMDFSYRVAKALEKAVPCKRVGMSVIGLEVPHVHVHLVPINEMADMQFHQKVKLNNDEFVALATKITANFE